MSNIFELLKKEHKKIKAAISKQKAIWASKTTPENKEPKEKEKDTDTTPKTETKEDAKDEDKTKTKEGDKKPIHKNPLFWLGIGALVLVIGGAIWYFMSGKNKGEDEEGSEPETAPQS